MPVIRTQSLQNIGAAHRSHEPPAANQTVLAYMVRFMQRMLQPEHVSSSKLTVHAISRFFAPMFLRPFGHSISDEATANWQRRCSAVPQRRV